MKKREEFEKLKNAKKPKEKQLLKRRKLKEKLNKRKLRHKSRLELI
jgi:hypothetical protein